MKKSFRPKPKKSARENARVLIPFLLEECFSYRTAVVRDPRNTAELHRMRIAGKSLRYIMEIFKPLFGKTFSVCLKEIIHVLGLMGMIHDKDTVLVDMANYLKKIHTSHNRRDRQDTFYLTRNISAFMRVQEIQRNELFNELCLTLERLADESFVQDFTRSMQEGW